MIIIIMGVSGVGKTTIGKLLAQNLNWEFEDADDYHPESNVEKMAAGIPLSDEDRLPWLQRLRQLIQERLTTQRPTVLACSALKEGYRALLTVDPSREKTVYLKADFATLSQRMKHRPGHFMPPQLLRSQLSTLEEPSDAITIDATHTPERCVADIIQKAGLENRASGPPSAR